MNKCQLLLLLAALGLTAAAPFYPDKSRLLLLRDDQGQEMPITTAADWAKRRAHILENMQAVMGPLPAPERKSPLDVVVIKEESTAKYLRRKITFVPEPDDRVPAWLLLPRDVKGPVPAVLCLHQTNGKVGKDEPVGLGGLSTLHYAHELAERGFVTLALDYPNFGEYSIDVYARGYQSATMKAIWNNMRAIDLLQSLPEVDGQRIGCIGHSLGGHNTMYTSVFDQRIKAMVSSCGFNSFKKYYKGNLKGWSHKGYMPRIDSVYHLDPAKMPFDFTEVVGALAPRAFWTNSPLNDSNFEVSGVRDCMTAAQPVYEMLGAKDRLAVIYPECKHDFPADVRAQAYDWLARWLK
jgi:fermentation-respiration switch protein FrsA (DUF1100 family)